MELYFTSILLFIIGAITSVFINENQKMKFCTIISGICAVLLSIPSLEVLYTGKTLQKTLFISNIFNGVDFVIDPLSAFFILIISIISFFGIMYGSGYLVPYLDKKMHTASHTFFLMMLTASMIGVVSCQNILFFLVVWEIMSLSSFFLVIFEGEKKEVLKSGIKYLVYMHISVVFILASFVILNLHTGNMNFSDFSEVLKSNTNLAQLVFVLSFIGFGTKAGFVPFHNWLPDAHPSAPTHISGIMSGVMIKTGIYGILRMVYLSGALNKEIAYFVLIIGVISALWGILYAINQTDLKKMLAYSSIENIGIIGIAIGIGLLGQCYNRPDMALFGFLGVFLHILNHSVFKTLLFCGAGAVYQKTHTRNMEQLGGLIKKMPYTGALFIIGSAAICALPPFGGFISEFSIYAGIISGIQTPSLDTSFFIILTAALFSLALVGTMAMLCFTKASGIVFLGSCRSNLPKEIKSDVSKAMVIPMGVLALFTLFLGIFSNRIFNLILAPVKFIENNLVIVQNTDFVLSILNRICIIFSIFIVIVGLICYIRLNLAKKSPEHTTWGCGYNKPNSRIQYTASSYSDLFTSTLKPLLKKVSHIKKPKNLFPKEAYYEVEIEDIEEAYIVKPLVKLDEKFLSRFEKIQNGNMQQYISFGLIFLILALIGAVYRG